MWFVDLAPIADPGAVAEAVASAVGAQDHSPTGAAGAAAPPELRAIARLGDRTVVRVLDNCEHVLDTAAAIAERLLSACRGLRVVATSREPLGVPGKHQCALGPMTDVADPVHRVVGGRGQGGGCGVMGPAWWVGVAGGLVTVVLSLV